MKRSSVVKVVLLLVLVGQVAFGVTQLSANTHAVTGLCNWHIDHCDYNGCTGTCGADIAAEKGKRVPAPADRCLCLFFQE